MLAWDSELDNTLNLTKVVQGIDTSTRLKYLNDTILEGINQYDLSVSQPNTFVTYIDNEGYLKINKNGIKTKGISIHAFNKLSIPTLQLPSNITSTSTKLNFNYYAGVNYSIDLSTNNNFSTYVTYTTTENFYNLTSLINNTNYYYRVRTYDQYLNYSDYSNIDTFRTL